MTTVPSASPSPCDKPTHAVTDFEFLQDPKDKNARLGTGSFATVKLAKEKRTGKLIALKMVNLENSKNKQADLQNLKIETNIHSRMEHPNIIQYYGYAREENNVYIILEYASKGNLYVYSQKRQMLSPRETFRYFFQTCLAIQYLHKKDVMHRDIKPENLLLDQDLNIKLCDFGWSTERIKEKRTTFCGTYEYMAPEIVYKRPYDYRIDIWSLGILLFELIHKEAPYKGRSLSEIFKSMSKGVINYSPTCDPDAKDLIHRILKLLPEERLSMSQILAHPFVQKSLDKDVELTLMYKQSFKVDKPLELEVKDPSTSGRKTSVRLVPAQDSLKIKNRQMSEDNRKFFVPLEEISSESSTNTKSSVSINKVIVERCDSDEENLTQISMQKKKATSTKALDSRSIGENLKKNLISRKPATFFDLSQDTPETPKSQSTSSIGFLSGAQSALFNTFSTSGRAPVLGTFTPTTSFRTPNTIANLATTNSNERSTLTTAIGLPETTTNLTSGKKLPVLISSHKPSSSMQLGSSSIAFHTVDNTSTQTPLYQKTRAIVNDSDSGRKPFLDLNAKSSSTRSIYNASKNASSTKNIDGSLTSKPSRELEVAMRTFVSPTGLPKRDFFRKLNSEMPKLDSFMKDSNSSTSTATTPAHRINLMIKRPQPSTETKLKVEDKEPASAGATKLTKEDFNRTMLLKTREGAGNSVRVVRPLLKPKGEEGKEKKTDKLKINLTQGILEKSVTPRSYNFRIIGN